MNWTVLLSAFAAIAVAQGFYLSIKTYRQGKFKARYFFFSLLLLALSLRIGKSIFYYFIPDIALEGVLLGGIGVWLIGPSFFLFLKHIDNDEVIRRLHIFHFIPAAILLLSFPVLQWAWMSAIYMAGAFHLMLYFLLSVTLFKRLRVGFMRYVGVAVGIMGLTFLYQHFISTDMSGYVIGAIVAGTFLYLLNFIGLERILPELKVKSQLAQNKTLLAEVSAQLNVEMNQNKLYRENNLTISKLSEHLNRPTYIIRETIRLKYKSSFTDFVNSHRIEAICSHLEQEDLPYTIEGLALDAGFTSISSFYESFKKQKGCTPNTYKKLHRNKAKLAS